MSEVPGHDEGRGGVRGGPPSLLHPIADLRRSLLHPSAAHRLALGQVGLRPVIVIGVGSLGQLQVGVGVLLAERVEAQAQLRRLNLPAQSALEPGDSTDC